MNVECTYGGNQINVVAISPNNITGKIDLVYVDSNNDLKVDTITMEALIATNSTVWESDYKNNFTATMAPTATDDSSIGYEVGSHWVDTVGDVAYICVDNTADTAIWRPTGVPNPLIFKGSIAAAGDFPNEADVTVGWVYFVTADVTDNQVGKTNTGDSFLTGDEIAWNGTAWIPIQSAVIWTDNGSIITTANTSRMVTIPNTLIGNTTPIGSWAGDGVSSAGTANITDVGGAAHGLSLAVGDLVHISASTTASHLGYYRIITAGATTVVLDRVLAATDTDLTVTFYKDVIYIGATDGTNGQRITGYSHQDKPLQIGGDILAATGHSLGGEDVLVGGNLEVNGKLWLDGVYAMSIASDSYIQISGDNWIRVNSTNGFRWLDNKALVFGTNSPSSFLWESNGTNDFLKLALAVNGVNTSGNFVIGGNFVTQDFDHAISVNPQVILHSALNPDTSNNQWGSFSHDQENFVITTGVNVGTGTGATTDENGILLTPRGGSDGILVGGLGHTLLGNTTRIGNWGGDGVSNGTATITDVGGAAHGLSLAAGDLAYIADSTTAADEGMYRIVSDDGTLVVLDRVLTGTQTDLNVTFYKDVILVDNTDGTNGQRIMNYSHQDKPLQIGGDVLAATGHSLGGEDVLIGGKLEINGVTYFDQNLYFAAGGEFHFVGSGSMQFDGTSSQYIVFPTGGGIYSNYSADQRTVSGPTTANHLVFTSAANWAIDHDHANQTDHTIFIHSSLSADTSNNQWGSFAHDQENFVITTGANTGAGSAPTTDENAISFAPRGTEEFKVSTLGKDFGTATEYSTTLTGFNTGSETLSGSITGLPGDDVTVRALRVYINGDAGADHNETFQLSFHKTDQHLMDATMIKRFTFNLTYSEVKTAEWAAGATSGDIDTSAGLVKYTLIRCIGGTPENVRISAITDADTIAFSDTTNAHAVDEGIVNVYEFNEDFTLTDSDGTNEIHVRLENLDTALTSSTAVKIEIDIK